MKLRRILYIILMFLLQIVANDYINLGPYVYVCFLPMMILLVPAGRSSIQSLLIAFGLGILVDLLSDGVLGLNAAAGVLMAGTLNFVFNVTVSRDNYEGDDCPNMYDVGIVKYLRLALLSFSIYFIAYVFLDGMGSRPFLFDLTRLIVTLAVNIPLAILINVAFFRRHR
ncbi:MAG: hypothetical protein LKK19_00055 [Bacteroidales bacterium]|jgi:hypothetical protein|nr:hypothetical protein [Bacteroidales bacterium]MCI2121086.1 hypothetical protein [Bacteroidales bacterium]MCI2144901.1 hypothetical protein [Bacteroidales bacterium]